MRINQRKDRGRHQRDLIRNIVHYCDKFEIFIRLFDEHFARILKVTDARPDVILASGLNHRFP